MAKIGAKSKHACNSEKILASGNWPTAQAVIGTINNICARVSIPAKQHEIDLYIGFFSWIQRFSPETRPDKFNQWWL